MRKDNIPYVSNGCVNYYPAKPLEELSLIEIKKKYIKCCAKANGDVSVCSKCKTPCREGERAIQLVANEVYPDPPVPLYGGKTLIERAKEENLKRRAQMEEEKNKTLTEYIKDQQNRVTARNGKIYWEGWWEESIASGDQLQWIITNMGLSKQKAQKKIYQYKYLHGLSNQKGSKKASLDSDIEGKLESLMKEQEEHKKKMQEYMDLYNKEKEKYEKIKGKADILCSAMDILND